MFSNHEQQNNKGAARRNEATPVRRAALHAPSFSNTRETNGAAHLLKNVGQGIEVWSTDGTERGRITTYGKHSKITLTPIPLTSANAEVAHIDWLAFSFTPTDGQTDPIAQLLLQLAQLLGLDAIPALYKGRGWNGYTTRHDLSNADGVSLGLIGSGGEKQRGTIHIELNAHACALVTNWHAFATFGKSLSAKITRIDLAHDDHEGTTFTIDKMVDWYKQGKFNCGGRKPLHTVNGDWLEDGSPSGRTLYIGKRENGKMLRIYEKGKQLGDSCSPWVRVEWELRGKDRIIPWEILTQSGNYLAGSYPCLNFLSEVQDKIRTITKAVTISYASAKEHARLMVGKLVNVMMMAAGGDAFQVVSELKRDGYPERLRNYAEFIPQALAWGTP